MRAPPQRRTERPAVVALIAGKAQPRFISRRIKRQQVERQRFGAFLLI